MLDNSGKNGSGPQVQSPVDLVIPKLRNVKKTRNGWTACCPAHDDHKSSLSISMGKDARVLLYCHAGCSLYSIVEAMSLDIPQLFAENAELRAKHRRQGLSKNSNFVEAYDYIDERGNLIYQVCRTKDKEFPSRRPVGPRKWEWNLKGVETVPYQLPQLIGAIKQEKTIFIVEGEKDVHRLKGQALEATTNSHGAGKWRKHLNKYFIGAQIVIIPDSDENGRIHGQNVAQHLRRVAKSVKIVELPGLDPEEKEDVSDWLDKHGTIEQLKSLVEETQYFKAPEKSEEVVSEPKYKTRYTFMNFEDLLGSIQWTWPNWLPKGFLTLIASQPGVGKSGLALRIASSIITGLSWPDGAPYEEELGAVLWCESEAAQAINLSRAVEWNIPLDKLVLPPLEDPITQVRLDNPDHKEAIKYEASKEDIKLIIVDSLRGCYRGDENTSESIEVVMWLAELARDLNKPILLTHHLRKQAGHEKGMITLDRVRGSSAIAQPARVVWGMDAPNSEQTESKRLYVIKSNIGEYPEALGFSITKKGIEFGDAPEEQKKETLLDRAKDNLSALLNKQPQPASFLYNFFEEEGISKRTVERAKQELKVVAFKREGKWFWSLPAPQGILEN